MAASVSPARTRRAAWRRSSSTVVLSRVLLMPQQCHECGLWHYGLLSPRAGADVDLARRTHLRTVSVDSIPSFCATSASPHGVRQRAGRRRRSDDPDVHAAVPIVDDARAGLAERYLAIDRYTISEVSDRLGFAASSAFFRWFR